MKSRYAWLGSLFAIIAALASMSAFVGAAGAKSHSKCYIATKNRYPTLISPCNKARIASGTKVTFEVRDLNSSAHKFNPTLDLSKHAPKHGRLRDDTSADGLFRGLNPVRGHRALFAVTPTQYTYLGYWEVTPGKYYIQIQQIESGCTTPHCLVYSPVTSITIH
jgi:hypothetical protein